MSLLKKISAWYYIGLLVWLIIIVLRKLGIYIPVINSHLTDLYTIPMYCYTIHFLMNQILGYQMKLDLKFILTSCVYITIIFEVLGPLFSTKFTGDIIDVICYFTGGILFYYSNKISRVSVL